MSSKTERERMVRSGDPLAKHSLNQYTMKNLRENEERGLNRKVERAGEKKQRKESERFNKALTRMVDGTASEGDILFAARVIGKHERIVDEFKIEGRDVAISIVDFTRRDRL